MAQTYPNVEINPLTGEPFPVPPKAGEEHTMSGFADPVLAAPRSDPLDTPTELTTRVETLFSELLRIEDETRPLVRTVTLKGAIRTALIRAQRDAAQRTVNAFKTCLEEISRS